MRLSLSLRNLRERLRQNLSLVFWVVLVVVLLADAWVLKHSWHTITTVRNFELPIPPSQLVRVNFGSYDQASERMSQAPNFVPPPEIGNNPFGVSDK